MTPADAARLLGIESTATPEQLEARFRELRTKLEEKIAKAPTPGLKEKYRASLTEITTAFETLILAADASTLPVLQREPSGGSTRPASAAQPGPATPAPASSIRSTPATRSSKSTKEFAIVALLAVLLLGGGGWWVVKTRAEKAEQTRVAAESTRAAADEAERRKQLATDLRSQLAEAGVAWDALEAERRDAERRFSDARSELRGLRDAPETRRAELSSQAARFELYSAWLNEFLVRHPAKVSRAKAEQLLSADAIDAAGEAVAELRVGLRAIDDEIAYQKSILIDGSGEVAIESRPAGIRYEFIDAYGRTFAGQTPANISGTPFTHVTDPRSSEPIVVTLGDSMPGKVSVRFIRPGWKDQVVETTCQPFAVARLATEYAAGQLKITSLPAGLPFIATNALGWKATGRSGGTLNEVPPGPVTVTVQRENFADVSATVDVGVNTIATVNLDQRPTTYRVEVAEGAARVFVNRVYAGNAPVDLVDLTPGKHQLQVEWGDYAPFLDVIEVVQKHAKKTIGLSFRELAVQNISCQQCGASGQIARSERCSWCNGRGWERCGSCDDKGLQYEGFFGNPVRCEACNGTKRRPCGFFGRSDRQCTGNGVARWREACKTCSGDGRLSRLDLAD